MHRGRHVGSYGRAAFFSTEEKTITSAMGGVVVTDDPAMARQIEAFQTSCAPPSAMGAARYLVKVIVFHLITAPRLYPYTRPLYKLLRSRIIAPGATSADESRGRRPPNYERRLSNGQAALALSQLRRLAPNLSHREEIARVYAPALAQAGLAVPQPPASSRPAFVRFPVRIRNKAAAMAAVAPFAVPGQWLAEPIDGAIGPGACDYAAGLCPRAEDVVRHLVSLPTHLKVQASDVEAILSALASDADRSP